MNGTTWLGTIDQASHAVVEIDGVNNASISCSVAPASSAFTIDATGKLAANSLSISIPSISTTATKASPAVGGVTFIANSTADNPYQSNACNFYFVPGTPETLSSGTTGSIFVAFDCPTLTNGAQAATCALSQGYAFFEHCQNAI